MDSSPANWRTPALILICGAVILTITMGMRQSFGLYLRPMSAEYGWGRETFAFAMALSNLLWGVLQPIIGAIADKKGSGRVIALCALLYAAGVALIPSSDSALTLNLTAGVMVGTALCGTSFGVIMGVIGRNYPPERRSFALGVATAGGSLGQFVMLPLSQHLIGSMGWQGALYVLAATLLLVVPLSTALAGASTTTHATDQSLRAALKEACGNASFRYLTLGFFVCGFHVAFIQVHLPAYLLDNGMAASVGAAALALIGLFNIFGSFLAGYVGGRFSKKYSLSIIYFARAVVIGVFLLTPFTEISVYVFAAAIGFLWLGTVPLTNGLVAQLFGTRYLATLFGIVFLSHQVGSFLGVWLAGRLFDLTGSYQIVWLASIGLGVLAGLVNLPIKEQPVVAMQIREPKSA